MVAGREPALLEAVYLSGPGKDRIFFAQITDISGWKKYSYRDFPVLENSLVQ